MKFSVIVPIYCVEEYLSQCVNSILSQNFDDFEVILVDDGSPDSCPQLCDQYAAQDNRVIVIHKENGGLSDARNAGIKVATGDFLCFVDSDDYWNSKEVLTKLQNVIGEYRPHVVQYGHRKFWQKENRLEEVSERYLSRYNGTSTDSILIQLVHQGNLMISACSMAIAREFILQHNLFFKKGIKSEDIEWAFRLFSCVPQLAFLDDYLYIYRMQRDGSITATVSWKHLCDYCDILEQSLLVIQKTQSSLQKPLLSYLMYHLLILTALCYRVDLQKAQRKEIFARLKVICRQYLLENTLDKKVKLAAVIYRCFGFSVMAKILGFYLNNRGR